MDSKTNNNNNNKKDDDQGHDGEKQKDNEDSNDQMTITIEARTRIVAREKRREKENDLGSL